MEFCKGGDTGLIIKFGGVSPEGLARLHTAVKKINGEHPAFREMTRRQLKILKSNFSHEGADDGSYVVEISIPYETNSNGRDSIEVPLEVVEQLFSAMGIFLPSA